MTMKNRQFNAHEQQTLLDIIALRRDIRGNNFLPDTLCEKDLEKILCAASLAPSVGLSQPWQFVVVQNQATRTLIADNHLIENEKAKAKFSDEKQHLYSQLKLEGIKEAPVNIAVFYQPKDEVVLGQNSMPEMGEYSVVCAIQNMWLMARSLNIGLGWVSILDPKIVKNILKAPAESKLVAYLCLGKVKEFLERPELEVLNWQQRENIKLNYEAFGQTNDEIKS